MLLLLPVLLFYRVLILLGFIGTLHYFFMQSSRAQILNKSTEYIKTKRADVESLQAQLAQELQHNEKLAAEVATLG